MANTLTIALSKGRILEQTLPLLEQLGIVPADDLKKSRKLILDTNLDDVKLLVIRAADVPTYVAYGAAQIGVSGKDVLLEQGSKDLYEPVDLHIAECRLVVAAAAGADLNKMRLRVATKYVNSTRQFFAAKGKQVEVIKLYGSMELAPLVGLADCIVDLVDTGATLKANGLQTIEVITNISSRLIVNKAAMKTQHERIRDFINRIEKAVAEMPAVAP